MNAQEIVAAVRTLIREPDQTPYRDGFAADLAGNESSHSILGAINTVQRRMAYLGYKQAYENVALAIGVQEYALNLATIRVVEGFLTAGSGLSITNIKFPLRRMRDDIIDTVRGNFTVATRRRPTEYYHKGGVIGFAPVPDAIYTATLFVHRVPSNLAIPTDQPSDMPIYFHDGLAFGAALLLANTEAENPAMQNRVPYLTQEWSAYWNDLATETKFSPVPPVPFVQPGDSGRM